MLGVEPPPDPLENQHMIAGEKIGHFVLLEPCLTDDKRSGWLCQCVCGNLRKLRNKRLITGRSRSCGCQPNRGSLSHGYSRIGQIKREFTSWQDMKQRCFNPRCRNYRNYGARGITVCERWIHSFEDFISDMGPCAPGFTLERLDVDGDYGPENCRWATRMEQAQNMRKTIRITYRGLVHTLSEWARLLQVRHSSLHYYLVKRRLSVAEAAVRLGAQIL